ncbi:MAG: SIS domain-containing protein [Deltaproteobacteria bacterium]|nr:SIS domain-containing protein [Deltaproteobacteria bacterium]
MSHFEHEIREQPDTLRRLLQAGRGPFQAVVEAMRRREVKFLQIAARGTSDNAARYAGYLFGVQNRLPVALAMPSMNTLYGTPPNVGSGLCIGISQAGESDDILAVINAARAQGALTLALTNRPGSPLAQAAELCLDLHAGEELAVAASKTYTAELMALALLSAELADDVARRQEVERVPDAVAATLELAEEIERKVERYRYITRCVVLGRGYNYATAFEVALKLKETSYVVAESYSSADFLHGPMALVDLGFPIVAIAPDGRAGQSMAEVMRAAELRGAELCVISDRDDLLSIGRTRIRLPVPLPEWLSPIVAVVPGQLFAFYLARARDVDPDRPRGLSKVTRTR